MSVFWQISVVTWGILGPEKRNKRIKWPGDWGPSWLSCVAHHQSSYLCRLMTRPHNYHLGCPSPLIMDLCKQMSLCWLLIFTCISHLSYWHQINWRSERYTRYIITKGGFELLPNWFNIAKKRENFNIIVAPDLLGFRLCPPNRIISPILAKKIASRVKNKKIIFCVFSITRGQWMGSD